MNGLRLKNAPDVGGERELEEDVAHRPLGSSRQASENIAPSVRSDTGPAALMAIRRRRGSNHASDVSTKAYGKIDQQLQAGPLDAAAERRHRQPVRRLVDRDHREAPEQEHEAAEADLVRDDERRPVAARDQVAEHADAGRRERER